MSRTRLLSISLILAALGLHAAPAAVAADKASASATAEAPKPETVRPELAKLLDQKTFSELMAAKKYDEVDAMLKKAEATPDLTPFEAYVTNRLRLSHAVTVKDDTAAMKVLEPIIASKRLTAAEQSTFMQALANYYFNAKNYAKSIEWMKRQQAETGDLTKTRPSMIRALYLMGDYAGSKQESMALLADDLKAGRATGQEDLRLLVSAAGKQKDIPTYIVGMEQLVKYYPTDELWTDLLRRVMNKPSFNKRLVLDVFRLQFVATKVMAAEDYMETAELALEVGFPTEAKKVMDAGFAAGVLGTGAEAAKHKKVRDQANKAAADDQKTIAAGEAAAMKAKDGVGLVNLGYAYVTMDQFDKGIDLMEKGIAKGVADKTVKGGVTKRADDYKLRLGTAYARAGKKDEATKVFESIKLDDGLSDLAKYWLLWLNRPAAAAAAAPAAAPAPAAGK